MDLQGWTPLMLACCSGSVEVVRALLEAGADISAFNLVMIPVVDYKNRITHGTCCCARPPTLRATNACVTASEAAGVMLLSKLALSLSWASLSATSSLGTRSAMSQTQGLHQSYLVSDTNR